MKIRIVNMVAILTLVLNIWSVYLAWSTTLAEFEIFVIVLTNFVTFLYILYRFSNAIHPGFFLFRLTRIVTFLLQVATYIGLTSFYATHDRNLITYILITEAIAGIFNLVSLALIGRGIQLPGMPVYDHDTAQVLCKFSDEVYKDPDEFNVPNFDVYDFVNIDKDPHDTQCYVASHKNKLQVVVAFRGTENNWKDQLTDVKFLASGYTYESGLKGLLWTLFSPIRVHSGFLNAYKVARKKVMFSIHKLLLELPNEPEVLITGHSLGGALATLCALDLKESYPDLFANLKLYTYGSPRLGNRRFVNHFIKNIPFSIRLVNDQDIVPSVPPSMFFLRRWIGYTHVPFFKYINKEGNFEVKPSMREKEPSPLKLIEGTLKVALSNQEPLDDHYSGNYCEKLSTMDLEQA